MSEYKTKLDSNNFLSCVEYRNWFIEEKNKEFKEQEYFYIIDRDLYRMHLGIKRFIRMFEIYSGCTVKYIPCVKKHGWKVFK